MNDPVFRVLVVSDNSWHFWLPFAFNILVAAGGFISVWILHKQTKAATLTAEAALRSQRAWLLASIIPLDLNAFQRRLKMEGDGVIRELQLVIKNVGPTPANIQAISVRAVLREYGSPGREAPKNGPEEAASRPLLVSNDSIEHFFGIETEFNMAELYQKMSSGEFTTHIFGYIRYLDVYGRQHYTNFGIRRRLKWQGAAMHPFVVDDYWPAEFNSAD